MWSLQHCAGSAGHCGTGSIPQHLFMHGARKERPLLPSLPFWSQHSWPKEDKQAKFTASHAELVALAIWPLPLLVLAAWPLLGQKGPHPCISTRGDTGPGALLAPGVGEGQGPCGSLRKRACVRFLFFLNKSSQRHHQLL